MHQTSHLFTLSTLSYEGIVNFSNNYTIVISGLSGAGKTEATKLLLNHIVNLAGNSESLDTQKVTTAIYILLYKMFVLM